MKKVEKAVCWICKGEYSSVGNANGCELRGLRVPHFKIGDTIKYQVCLSGSDPSYDERIGTVLDILFPIPTEYSSVGYALMHDYYVSYLVRRTKSKIYSSDKFFDQENIDLPVEVVSDGLYLEERKEIIVAKWDDYVAKIEQQNPQLKDRLARFTAKICELGCLD